VIGRERLGEPCEEDHVPELFLLDSTEGLTTSLRGFVRQHPTIELNTDPLYLHHQTPAPTRRVGIVSGGGSGHEPLHGGFVGRGMLDAAVPGRIFASPHNRQVYEASKAVARADGVLHIVKNYTGDRINFGIGAERLAADGIQVARVLVDDDVATDLEHTATGRRGTAATIVVEKIVGAAADRGDGLTSLAELGNRVSARSRSIAVASRPLTSAHTGRPAFELQPDELEYGVGIHGERASTAIPTCSVDDLVRRMVGDVMTALSEGDDPLLLVVNGLGATTDLELFTVLELAATELAERGHTLAAVLAGSFVVALDMSGFSITVTQLESGWLDLWQASTDAPAWSSGSR
jgi:dihydroxyacetone kinase-like protein